MNNGETATCPDCGEQFDPQEWSELKPAPFGSKTEGTCPDCKDPSGFYRERMKEKGRHLPRHEQPPEICAKRREKTTPCLDCAKVICYSPDYEPGSRGTIANKPERCEDCEEKHRNRLARDTWQSVASRRSEIVGEEFWNRGDPSITPKMRATSINDQRFNRKAWEKGVNSWRPTIDVSTLGMWGETGTCKTRMGLLKARQLLMEDAEREIDYRLGLTLPNLERLLPEPDWDWRELEHRSWRDEAQGKPGIPWQELKYHRQQWIWSSAPQHMLLSSDLALRAYATKVQDRAEIIKGEHLGLLLGHVPFEDEENRNKRLSKLRTVRYLLIDELGKSAEKAAQLPRLKLLIEHRMEHGLCTIWTANSRPEQFLAHGGEEYCLPLARRLAGEDSLVIHLSSPHLPRAT